jgi:cell division protein FtsI (penicillin-binding protein 3)
VGRPSHPGASRHPGAPPRRRPPTRPAGSVWRAGKPRRRLIALAVVASLLFAAVLVRVGLLQTVDASALQAAGLDQRRSVVPLPADRGVIFDRNGTELALSVPTKTVWADPLLVAKVPGRAAEVAAALGSALALPPETVATLQEQLGDPALRFAYVARFVSEEAAAAVEALELPGIFTMNEPQRVYPAGDVAKSVIGSTDAFGDGIAGLEAQYDQLLTGDPGELVYEQDQGGNTIPTGRRDMVPPVPGDDLVLTIDKDLQYLVEQLLIRQVAAANARGGMVVIQDTATGEVLAMANVRRDPDTGQPAVSSANLSVIDAYEPGSVAKLITAAAALEEGVIDTERHMEVPGRIRLYDFDFTDAWPHGTEWWGIRDIVRLSSNIGTIFLARDLAPTAWRSTSTTSGSAWSPGSGSPGRPGASSSRPPRCRARRR